MLSRHHLGTGDGHIARQVALEPEHVCSIGWGEADDAHLAAADETFDGSLVENLGDFDADIFVNRGSMIVWGEGGLGTSTGATFKSDRRSCLGALGGRDCRTRSPNLIFGAIRPFLPSAQTTNFCSATRRSRPP